MRKSRKNVSFTKIIATLLTVVLVFTASLVVLKSEYNIEYENLIQSISQKNDIDYRFVCSIIKAESNWNPKAVSKKGAIGLMQILPSTAKWLAKIISLEFEDEELYNPTINISLGVAYLAYLNEKYQDLNLVAIAYNAGEGNLDKWLQESKDIQFSETKKYVKRVEFNYKIYKLMYNNIAV